MDKRDLFKKTGIGISKALLVALITGAVAVAPGGVQGILKVLEDLFEDKEFEDYSPAQVQRALKYLRRKKPCYGAAGDGITAGNISLLFLIKIFVLFILVLPVSGNPERTLPF